jgi:hypothetical protein
VIFAETENTTVSTIEFYTITVIKFVNYVVHGIMFNSNFPNH